MGGKESCDLLEAALLAVLPTMHRLLGQCQRLEAEGRDKLNFILGWENPGGLLVGCRVLRIKLRLI